MARGALLELSRGGLQQAQRCLDGPGTFRSTTRCSAPRTTRRRSTAVLADPQRSSRALACGFIAFELGTDIGGYAPHNRSACGLADAKFGKRGMTVADHEITLRKTRVRCGWPFNLSLVNPVPHSSVFGMFQLELSWGSGPKQRSARPIDRFSPRCGRLRGHPSPRRSWCLFRPRSALGQTLRPTDGCPLLLALSRCSR